MNNSNGLTVLNLANNQLTKFEIYSLETLPNLKELDLSSNKFTDWSQLTLIVKKLQFLNLSGNTLKRLEPSILCIQSLENLDLSNNDLSQFDTEEVNKKSEKYANLSKAFKHLNLSGNR